jgi:hypothetical protein
MLKQFTSHYFEETQNTLEFSDFKTIFDVLKSNISFLKINYEFVEDNFLFIFKKELKIYLLDHSFKGEKIYKLKKRNFEIVLNGNFFVHFFFF